MEELPENASKEEIEQWQREHPMDYLKAVDLIGSSLNSDEVFRAIYDIAHWYVPDRLFKYYSLSDALDGESSKLNAMKLSALSEGKIYTAPPSAMNDPFDGKGFFYDHAQVRPFCRNPEGADEPLNFSEMLRLSSFTSAGNGSLPMWAHYANNHKGYCVAYDMTKDNDQLSGTTFPVQYLDHRIDITNFMVRQMKALSAWTEEMISKGEKRIVIDDLKMVYIPLLLHNVKDSFWSYEQEFRCTIGAGAPGAPYVAAKPDEIYVGLRCSPEHCSQLVSIGQDLGIKVWKMEYENLSPRFALRQMRIA